MFRGESWVLVTSCDAVFKMQTNCIFNVRQCFFVRFALRVTSLQFRTKCKVTVLILFNHDGQNIFCHLRIPFSYTSGFTGVGNLSPFTPAIKFFAAISAILPRVAMDALAMCGTTRQFGKVSSGLSM